MFASQYGQSYNQAIGDGKSEDEAMTYAFLNGATSAVLEKTLGVVGGGKLAQSITGKLIKDEAVKSALGKFIIRTGASSAGEFTEETLESLLQPIIYNITTSGEDQKLDGKYLLNAFRDGLIGGFTGGAFEAAGTSAKIRQGKNAAVNMFHEFNAQNVNTQKNLTYDDINSLSDADLRNFNGEMTKAYADNLHKTTNFTDEQIQNYVDEAMKDTSREGTINRILVLQEELGVGQGEIDVKNQQVENIMTDENTTVNENAIAPTVERILTEKQITPAAENVNPFSQEKSIAKVNLNQVIPKISKIQKILSVDKAQLSKMSVYELKQFAAAAAKINAEIMNIKGESFDNYIKQSTQSNDSAVLIKKNRFMTVNIFQSCLTMS